MIEPTSEKPVLSPAQSAALLRALVLARKRAFWFNLTFFMMLLLGAAGVAAQSAGINARSGGWESTALIAGFFAGCGVMAVGVAGFSVRHIQAHRAARELEDLMKPSSGGTGGDSASGRA